MIEFGLQMLGHYRRRRVREELDRRGRDGWELVAVEHVQMSGGTRLYFKKPA